MQTVNVKTCNYINDNDPLFERNSCYRVWYSDGQIKSGKIWNRNY